MRLRMRPDSDRLLSTLLSVLVCQTRELLAGARFQFLNVTKIALVKHCNLIAQAFSGAPGVSRLVPEFVQI